MFFLLDTCFISHCYELFINSIIDIRPFLEQYRLAITDEVKKEIEHYGLDDFIPLYNFVIIPLNEADFALKLSKYEEIKGLDAADQTLWYVAGKDADYAVLTDDGALLLACQISNIPALRLPDFQLAMIREGVFPKKMMAKCLRFWEAKKRYSIKSIRGWRKELQKL